MLIDKFELSGFQAEIYDSILTAPLRHEWGNLTGRHYHLRPELLSVIERAQPSDLQCRYMLVRTRSKNSEIVTLVYLQVLEFDHSNFNFNNAGILNSLAKLFLRFRSFRIVMAGNLFSVDFSPVCYHPQKISPSEIVTLVLEYGKRNKSDVTVFKDMPDAFHKAELTGMGLIPFESDLTMQMEIDGSWNSLEDYSRSLTHKYSQRFRKVRRQGESIIRQKITRPNFEYYSKDIGKLFKQVSEKQTVRMGIVDEKYFQELLTLPNGEFWLTGYFLKDQLIGFSSYLTHGEKLEVHYIGIDYTYNKSHAIYFNILFDGIEQAIKQEKKQLELGRTAREAKAVLGCQPIYFNDYIFVKNQMVNRFLNFLKNHFQKNVGESWQNRHPFKKNQEL